MPRCPVEPGLQPAAAGAVALRSSVTGARDLCRQEAAVNTGTAIETREAMLHSHSHCSTVSTVPANTFRLCPLCAGEAVARSEVEMAGQRLGVI